MWLWRNYPRVAEQRFEVDQRGLEGGGGGVHHHRRVEWCRLQGRGQCGAGRLHSARAVAARMQIESTV